MMFRTKTLVAEYDRGLHDGEMGYLLNPVRPNAPERDCRPLWWAYDAGYRDGVARRADVTARAR